MWLVVGLGNPTDRYLKTRHNAGFRVVEDLAANEPWSERFDGLCAKGSFGGSPAVLLKPLTYMNASGRSVRRAADFFKIPLGQLLIVHDELDVPFGEVRLKLGGGEAGHNGLKSISRELGSRDYIRLRVGIGRPPADFRGQVADFVLQAFAPAEEVALNNLVQSASDAIRLVLTMGFEQATNEVNRRR